ncbi:ribosome biogenesis protein BMS1 homolog [Papaver somniferum]|uniref:ribosome biogenesis protein BMS1 homolog n=1 Tax=Papaver somniferum TaxID=3469 RepID=UPI000E702E32|nr:ribosome biogenesis protein BMS1 homolog [Papaver somniferum]
MIDAAKYADAVMFLIDAGYGFEMETFEFLELLKVHGMPKVMGVLTYLDSFKDEDVLAKTQKHLLDQFQANIHNGAKVFCLSSRHNAMYLEHEISELASYISTMEFHPLSWRAARPYMLVDLFEDVTPLEKVQMDKECPRYIMLEGYLRGCDVENGSKVHIAGVGDFPLASITSLTDPFPLLSVDTNNLKVPTVFILHFNLCW